MHSVSVVIPTYNQSQFLGAAIDAALTQSIQPIEVIVVDDGSTDETSELLDGYGARIRTVRQENLGVAAARNSGAGLARGSLLAFLDSDDVWMPEKLARQLQRFQRDPDLGLVHCGLEFIDQQGVAIGLETGGLDGDVAIPMLLFRRPVILGGGSGALIRKDIFDGLGGFDSRLSTSADWDLYYRVASRSRVGFVPDILLRYRIHKGNMHRDVDAMERDMLLAFEKAFGDSESSLSGIKRQCYGNLHSVLAGSFYVAGQYGRFAKHAAKALLMSPANVPRFLGYPLRRRRKSDLHIAPCTTQVEGRRGVA
jgi:glycosyltransferase involved in cell wall biosynthesis